jgi:hypothetical protein
MTSIFVRLRTAVVSQPGHLSHTMSISDIPLLHAFASELFRLSRAQQTAISVMMMSGAGEVISNKTPTLIKHKSNLCCAA